MATEEQLRANRANAKKSTGPKTERGKNTSSRNALTHGLTGSVTVLPDEDQRAREVLRARFVESYAPRDEPELVLVEQMAHHAWQLMRARGLEDMLDAYDHTMWEIAAIEAREHELSYRMENTWDGDNQAMRYVSDEDIKRKDELLKQRSRLVGLAPIMRMETETARDRLARHENRHLNALLKLMTQFQRLRALSGLLVLPESGSGDGGADR